MDKRITLTTVFSGPIKGMKRVIKEFLQDQSIGCILQTTMVSNGQESSRMTLLVMEGESKLIYETRDLLVLQLVARFEGIKQGEATGWKKNHRNLSFPK